MHYIWKRETVCIRADTRMKAQFEEGLKQTLENSSAHFNVVSHVAFGISLFGVVWHTLINMVLACGEFSIGYTISRCLKSLLVLSKTAVIFENLAKVIMEWKGFRNTSGLLLLFYKLNQWEEMTLENLATVHDWQRKVWKHLSGFHIPIFESVLEVKLILLLIHKHMWDVFDTDLREMQIPLNNWKMQWEYVKTKEPIWFLGELSTWMSWLLVFRVATLGKFRLKNVCRPEEESVIQGKRMEHGVKMCYSSFGWTHGLFQVCGRRGDGRRGCTSLPASLICRGLVPDVIHTLSSQRGLA